MSMWSFLKLNGVFCESALDPRRRGVNDLIMIVSQKTSFALQFEISMQRVYVNLA